MNVLGGAKNIKGNPIVLAEYKGWGVFPETLNNFRVHNLKKMMRFRHGSYAPKSAGLGDKQDAKYVPRSRANCSFRDGHVERLAWSQVVRLETSDIAYSADRPPQSPYSAIWRGSPIPRPAGWRPWW